MSRKAAKYAAGFDLEIVIERLNEVYKSIFSLDWGRLIATIAIIGIDGSGKTTQAKLLAQLLKKRGYKAKYVQPVFILSDLLSTLTKLRLKNFLPSPRKLRVKVPSSTKFSVGIQKLLVKTLGYPYALLSYGIMAFYSIKNVVVVCDGYFFQFFFDLYGEHCEKIIKIFPKPDITYFLQGDLELFRSRMINPFDKTAPKSYYLKVYNLLERIARGYGFIRIDATLDVILINEFLLECWESSYS